MSFSDRRNNFNLPLKMNNTTSKNSKNTMNVTPLFSSLHLRIFWIAINRFLAPRWALKCFGQSLRLIKCFCIRLEISSKNLLMIEISSLELILCRLLWNPRVLGLRTQEQTYLLPEQFRGPANLTINKLSESVKFFFPSTILSWELLEFLLYDYLYFYLYISS